MPSVAAEALALLQRGDSASARGLIDAGCARGDGDALAMRALWRVEGRLVLRDLPAARADLAAADTIGAARILAGFLAIGIGGTRDWAGALAMLDDWADRDPIAAQQRALIAAMAIDAKGDPLDLPMPQSLSDNPMIVALPGLLTAPECDLLATLSDRRLRPALIFHEGQKRFIADPVRDSDAAGFPIVSEWPAVHAINRRLAAASGTAVEQGETLQVLRYRPGQQYRPHLDAVPGLTNQRSLTLLIYLNDAYDGGETHFTRLPLTHRGRKGDGLLFANTLPDSRPDPMSEHAGLPVQSGIKLIASRWIRQRPPEVPDGFGQHEAMA
ncbi:peptidyl prolyl 4-hydroxylase subunit alpha [Sphingobium terrigena]|uniref:Peptidyl prolyl 4-hydroxylase subunit alpha n=1 Tax=Sphingobium terrigena TaxID=2304063 RepID=A0A418YQZ4_9SPHN|nr:2OG-Fe(II) oxygenase [Sphingobium terrigena]RJG53957.1 peptidyl prolyl 4-hydroxylase subunit alpha [Sphingobium terrigena]